MLAGNLFAIFILTSVLYIVNGENCEFYDGNGICWPPCPEGLQYYSSDCMNPTMSRRTCRQPQARSLGVRCDYLQCRCPEPKVLDEATNKCVAIADCSDQSSVKGDKHVKV